MQIWSRTGESDFPTSAPHRRGCAAAAARLLCDLTSSLFSAQRTDSRTVETFDPAVFDTRKGGIAGRDLAREARRRFTATKCPDRWIVPPGEEEA